MGSSSCFDVRAWRSLFGPRGYEMLGMEQREVCDVSVVLGEDLAYVLWTC